ncbi:MAG: NAD(+) kinase [Pseudomonadota bacterium]
MTSQFQRIGIIGRHDDPRVSGHMQALVRHLNAIPVAVFAAESLDLDLALNRVPEQELASQVDLIIAIGGDGTMLYACGLAGRQNVPLLGVNRGRLGFLADIIPDEMLNSVDRVLAGDFTRESRLMLTTTLERADGSRTQAEALNDIVLQRRETGRMVDFETRVDGRYVNTHAGDGLIVATPTGSTAYSLSCGGPIIEPGLDAVVVVPICPHTLTDRPIVMPADQPIDINMLERDGTKAEVTADGRSIGDIHAGDRLRICRSERRAILIHPPGYDYYEILRSKLYWGRDLRTRVTSGEGSAEC